VREPMITDHSGANGVHGSCGDIGPLAGRPVAGQTSMLTAAFFVYTFSYNWHGSTGRPGLFWAGHGRGNAGFDIAGGGEG
jgi:hypothetical protein